MIVLIASVYGYLLSVARKDFFSFFKILKHSKYWNCFVASTCTQWSAMHYTWLHNWYQYSTSAWWKNNIATTQKTETSCESYKTIHHLNKLHSTTTYIHYILKTHKRHTDTNNACTTTTVTTYINNKKINKLIQATITTSIKSEESLTKEHCHTLAQTIPCIETIKHYSVPFVAHKDTTHLSFLCSTVSFVALHTHYTTSHYTIWTHMSIQLTV